MRYLILILLSIVVTAACYGQRPNVEEYKMQQEQIRKTELLRQLDSGVYYMDIGEYATADLKFKLVLENIKSVPSDLTFHFGKNSFHLEKYKQSIDWLTKYIQLKGTNGQFSEEAAALLKRAEEE
jgi:hypothetical protein